MRFLIYCTVDFNARKNTTGKLMYVQYLFRQVKVCAVRWSKSIIREIVRRRDMPWTREREGAAASERSAVER